MLRTRLALFTLFLPLVPVVVAAEPARPFQFPEGKHEHGELKFRAGLPVLVVEGTPAEMGQAVGKLGLGPGRRAMDYPRELFKVVGVDGLLNLATVLGRGMYRTQFPAWAKAEMEAMSKAADVPLDALILGNTMFDLKGGIACSALLVEPSKSATGGPLLARNLDYPSLGYIHHHTLVTVYRQPGKHAFAAVGFPGLVGCLSGINDAGLTVAVLEVVQIKNGERSFNPEAVPYAINFRRLLEECTTIDEAYKALSDMKRTTLNNLVVADKTGVAVFEISPGKVVKRTAEGGLGICTNHFCDQVLKVPAPENHAYTLDRFKTLDQIRNGNGKLGVEALHQQLHKANLGHLTLQTMVFEPATLKLHLAYGHTPASGGELRTLELKELFEKK